MRQHVFLEWSFTIEGATEKACKSLTPASVNFTGQIPVTCHLYEFLNAYVFYLKTLDNITISFHFFYILQAPLFKL